MDAIAAEWSRQQAALAARVSQADARDWRLGAADSPLRLIGGLDISFLPAPSPDAPVDAGAAAAAGAGGPAGPAAAAVQSAPSAAPSAAPESAVAALAVLSFPALDLVYQDLLEVELAVPYRAGFLGFREVPAYMRLLERAREKGIEPQVLMVDGFGVLHPRGLGSASHLGVLAGVPTIGAAKNLLHVGGLVQREVRAELHAAQHAQQAQQAQHAQQGDAAAALGEDSSGQERQSEPAGEEDAGGPAQPLAAEAAVAAAAAAAAAAGGAAPVPAPGAAPLVLRASGGEVLGAAVLPAGCSRPIYVSVGHRLSLGTAVEITLRCCRHRVPEPIRQADLRSRERVRQLAAARQAGAGAAQQAAAAAP